MKQSLTLHILPFNASILDQSIFIWLRKAGNERISVVAVKHAIAP
jgi:hypothetical protein